MSERPTKKPRRTPSPTKLPDIDQTPLARRPLTEFAGAISTCDAAFGSNTSESSVRSSAASRRSTSPVKKTGDLHTVGDGIFYEPFDDESPLADIGNVLLDRIRRPRQGFAFIPLNLENHRMTTDPSQIDRSDTRGLTVVSAELNEVERIVQESKRCTSESQQEPEWNHNVHGPLLRLALQGHAGVGTRYMYVE